MFVVTIKEHGGDWEVWASLVEPDAEHPLEEMPESFILGTGETLEIAKRRARKALKDAGAQILAWRADK